MHVEDFLSVRLWSFLRCVTVSVFADKSLNFTVRLVAGGRAGAFATSDYAWCVGHAFSVRIAPRFIRSLWWTVEKVCHYFGTEKVRQKTSLLHLLPFFENERLYTLLLYVTMPVAMQARAATPKMSTISFI